MVNQSMSIEWMHGLCGCFTHCGICIYTLFCPCIIAGKIAGKVGDSCCLCCLVIFVPLLGLVCRTLVRQKVREQRQIGGNIVTDCFVACFCPLCALCQEAEEISALDMAQSMALAIDMERE